jgi:hypothetical protein
MVQPFHICPFILLINRTGHSPSRLCPGIQSLDYVVIMQSLCSPPFVGQSPPLSYKFAATNVCLAPNVNTNLVLVTQMLES